MDQDQEKLTIGYGGEETECNKCGEKSDEVVTLTVEIPAVNLSDKVSLTIDSTVVFICKDCLTEAITEAIDENADTVISVS